MLVGRLRYPNGARKSASRCYHPACRFVDATTPKTPPIPEQLTPWTSRAVDSFSLEAIDSFSFTWLFNNLRQTHGCGIEQFAIGTSFGHP